MSRNSLYEKKHPLYPITVCIEHDESPEHPMDIMDFASEIFQTDYSHNKNITQIEDVDEYIKERKRDEPGLLCLHKYGRLAIVTPEKGRKEWGRVWKVKALACMFAELKMLDQWSEGQVYGIVMETEGGAGDSCWGFYTDNPEELLDTEEYLGATMDSYIEKFWDGRLPIGFPWSDRLRRALDSLAQFNMSKEELEEMEYKSVSNDGIPTLEEIAMDGHEFTEKEVGFVKAKRVIADVLAFDWLTATPTTPTTKRFWFEFEPSLEHLAPQLPFDGVQADPETPDSTPTTPEKPEETFWTAFDSKSLCISAGCEGAPSAEALAEVLKAGPLLHTAFPSSAPPTSVFDNASFINIKVRLHREGVWVDGVRKGYEVRSLGSATFIVSTTPENEHSGKYDRISGYIDLAELDNETLNGSYCNGIEYSDRLAKLSDLAIKVFNKLTLGFTAEEDLNVGDVVEVYSDANGTALFGMIIEYAEGFGYESRLDAIIPEEFEIDIADEAIEYLNEHDTEFSYEHNGGFWKIRKGVDWSTHDTY